MSNSSIPPGGPNESGEIIVLAPRKGPKEGATPDKDLKRRRTDVSDDVHNVVPIREGIRMRRKKSARKIVRKGGIRKARPRVDGLTIPEGPKVKTISGGKVGEEKIAAREHRERMAQIAGCEKLTSVSLTLDPDNVDQILPQNGADELLAIDAAEGEEIFPQVARVLIGIWPQTWRRFLTDQMVESIVRELQEGTVKKRLLVLLYNYEQKRRQSSDYR